MQYLKNETNNFFNIYKHALVFLSHFAVSSEFMEVWNEDEAGRENTM